MKKLHGNTLRLRDVGKLTIDAAILGTVYLLALLIRFDGDLSLPAARLLLVCVFHVVVVKLTCLFVFGAHKLTWSYVSLPEARVIAAALATASVILGASIFTARLLMEVSASAFAQIPFGVLFIDLPMSFLAVMAAPVLVRVCRERFDPRERRRPIKVPTILVGAGEVGAMVAQQIAVRADIRKLVVGFLDDDPNKWNTVIHGFSVLGPTTRLADIAASHGIKQALITLGKEPKAAISRIACLCEECGVSAKIIPDVLDLVAGRVQLSRLCDVPVEDILHREPVRLNGAATAAALQDRVVLVTGAGGSIGSELCREICRYRPSSVILLDRAESNLFYTHRRVSQEFPHVSVIPCLADICDGGRIKQIVSEYRPEIVFHAAAYKHVPVLEEQPAEAIKNNILGTRTLAQAAHRWGVGYFVMISTDKAVKPSSVMGVSKRIAELYIQALSQRSDTHFMTVRFGNVLGSVGSVIPIFQEQLAKGGPLTVTHPDMTRYFMTIPEACQLVLRAATMGKGGETFILDMGEPVKIVDLARDMIRRSGLSLNEVEIRFTGTRPGEKLFEELAFQEENVTRTQEPKILLAQRTVHNWQNIDQAIEELRALVDCPDHKVILAKLKEIVPEYQSDPAPQPEPAVTVADQQAPAVNGQPREDQIWEPVLAGSQSDVALAIP